MNIGCILLAAGLSKRFGGDKLLTPLKGVPMGVYAIRLHGGLPYSHKVLITQANRAPLIAAAQDYGFTVIVNPAPEEGIASSLRLGLNALPLAETDGALFGVCDQPYLTRETVARLTDTFQKNPGYAVAPSFAGQRGNPVIFPREMFEELLSLKGDVGGGALLKRHPEKLLLVPAASAAELRDIDTKG